MNDGFCNNTQFFDFYADEDSNSITTVVSNNKNNEPKNTLTTTTTTTTTKFSEHQNQNVCAIERPKSANDDIVDAVDAVPLWSIEDSLFYPLGLINHGTDTTDKSVFVTWCDNYLLSFVFKTNSKTQQTKLNKVRRVEVENPTEQILEILILELNTLLLMSSGNVYYFSGVSQIEAISWLTGVRAMSAATTHSFSVIRLNDNDHRLYLEVYRDIVHIGKCETPTLMQQFDITYDEQNLFNCQWQNENFTLNTQLVLEETTNYLTELINKICDLSTAGAVHFFTVSSSLYALIADDTTGTQYATPDFHIELLCTYAANVLFVKILCARQLCLVFLACGSIDIWYFSNIANVVQRRTHHTGSSYTDYEFATTNGCFYFSDEQKVGQLQFVYDAPSDNIQVQETYKSIAGIVACTWVQNIQQLVCLSCNNIFYRLHFEAVATTKQMSFENLNELYELTPARIKQLLTKAEQLYELSKLPIQLDAEIAHEYKQQQLLGVASKKHIYSQEFIAHIVYTTQLPSANVCAQNTVLLYACSSYKLTSDSYFALIHIKIPDNQIFEFSQWNLYLAYDTTAQLMMLPKELLQHNLCLIVPFVRNAKCVKLPKFKLNLVTFIKNPLNDFLALTLPFALQRTTTTYVQLCSQTTCALTLRGDYNLNDLIANFLSEKQTDVMEIDKKEQTTNEKSVNCTLKVPKHLNFQKLLQIFNINEQILNKTDSFELQFLTAKIKIVYKLQESCIKLTTTTDAVALFYMKLFLFQYFKENAQISNDEMDVQEVQQLLMQLQCEIERGYGGALLAQNDDYISASILHLEHLKCIYKKLRNEIFDLFSS